MSETKKMTRAEAIACMNAPKSEANPSAVARNNKLKAKKTKQRVRKIKKRGTETQEEKAERIRLNKIKKYQGMIGHSKRDLDKNNSANTAEIRIEKVATKASDLHIKKTEIKYKKLSGKINQKLT
jgi:hypothetical protein